MREPAIFWWPGKIKPGVVMEMATTMDILPTILKLAKVDLPGDRVYDGFDISPLLLGTGNNPRDVVYYYRDTEVFAIRKGDFKAHFITQPEYGSNKRTVHDTPLLFNLSTDPAERFNVAEKYPEKIDEIKKIFQQHQLTIVPVENQLEK
jgi:arylsulfatase A-like enzyme